MNGGAPIAPPSPLRALRLDPVLVDDLALDARLAAGVSSVAAPADPESVRWARAWLVVWQGVLHAAGVIGTVPPSSVSTPLADVPGLKGDPAGTRRAAAIDLLERLALLHRTDGGAAARLDDALFTRHRAGLEVDWAAAARACRHEPAPLLTLRALVEVVVPPDAPTPVSLRELAGRTGYAEKQVRVALRRLAEAGVISAVESAGQATRYRLTPATLGRPVQTPAPSIPQPIPQAAPNPGPTPPVNAPAAQAAQPPALRLTLNGVTLGIAPGLAADVTLDADGVPHVSLRPQG